MPRHEDCVGATTFVAEKLHGLRAWHIGVDQEGAIRLSGLHLNEPWPHTGKTNWARCSLTHVRKHKAPAAQCNCGLYALHPWSAEDRSELQLEVHGRLSVVGVVEAWGQVQLHEEGFRAQFARPAALVVLGASPDSGYGRLVAEVARGHRAELMEAADIPALARNCELRGLGFSKKTVRRLLTWDRKG